MIEAIVLLTIYTMLAVLVIGIWLLMALVAHDICRTVKTRLNSKQ
jgi:hypothetical protein